MLKFFQKRPRIVDMDYNFLSAIVKGLPPKYSYLNDQVTTEFILDKKINKLGDYGTYSLVLNADLEEKYSDKSFPQFFIIENIGIWNNSKNKYELVDLHILEGMIAGFRVQVKYKDLDFEKINISSIKEKHFENKDGEFLKKLIGKVPSDILKILDIESTFKIEIEKDEFYVIKDFEDGNYLAMDLKGGVYGMIHDPYEIEKIFDKKEDFFRELQSGNFSISEYYERKLSV